MSKRLLLANILLLLGAGFINRFLYRNRIIIFNYHRIREDTPADTFFDDGVFGPSQNQLKQQLEFLRKHSTILSEADLIKALSNTFLPGKGPYSMVTFDDAYIDNYELALPVLSDLDIPATFFVPAFMIENRNVGWWDKIAYIVKNSKKSEIVFRGQKLLLTGRKSTVIEYLHSLMKLSANTSTTNLVMELAEAADTDPPSQKQMDKELMNWEQLKKAHAAGVSLGSHTLNHHVLATLDERAQAVEIIDSKKFLEQKLNIEIKSLAFPVGGFDHFNETTLKLVEKAGYYIAFSFNTGIADFQTLVPHAIPRLASPEDFPNFRALFNFPQLMDYHAAKRRAFQKKAIGTTS